MHEDIERLKKDVENLHKNDSARGTVFTDTKKSYNNERYIETIIKVKSLDVPVRVHYSVPQGEIKIDRVQRLAFAKVTGFGYWMEFDQWEDCVTDNWLKMEVFKLI